MTMSKDSSPTVKLPLSYFVWFNSHAHIDVMFNSQQRAGELSCM